MAYEILAKFYDDLISEYFDYNKWFKYLISYIGGNDKEILELGCGTGLITEKFSKHGYKVTCIDKSIDMLTISENKTRDLKIRPQFFNMDIVNLPKIKEHDACIATCDVINYIIKDVNKVFNNVYENLKPGGVFLFDIITEVKAKKLLGNNTFFGETDDFTYIWNNEYMNNKRLIDQELIFFIKKGSLYEKVTERHIERIYSCEEICKSLKAAGFSDISFKSFLSKKDCCGSDLRIQVIAYK